MKVFRMAVVIALLASPAYLASTAYAQMPAMNLLHGQARQDAG